MEISAKIYWFVWGQIRSFALFLKQVCNIAAEV